MNERKIRNPSIIPTSGLIGLIAIILLLATAENSAPNRTASLTQSTYSAIVLNQWSVGDAAFSAKITSFSPELYDMSAFGDHEGVID